MAYRQGEALIDYNVLALKYGRVIPKSVVEVSFIQGTTTTEGDSGSPVFNNDNGDIFQGMHIAGDATKAFFIPAYDLLRAGNYLMTSGDEMPSLAFPPF